MKLLLGIVFALVSLCNAIADTWIIHGSKDNCLYIDFRWNFEGDGSNWYWTWGNWDNAYDLEFPETPDSGYYHFQMDDWVYLEEYILFSCQETLTFIMPAGSLPYYCQLMAPHPLYSPRLDVDVNLLMIPGEYWIDYSQTGSGRVSTVNPDDFGKRAWDGSINPNYVEPVITKRGKKPRK